MCCETRGGIDCVTLWQTTVGAEMISFDHGSGKWCGVSLYYVPDLARDSLSFVNIARAHALGLTSFHRSGQPMLVGILFLGTRADQTVGNPRVLQRFNQNVMPVTWMVGHASSRSSFL